MNSAEIGKIIDSIVVGDKLAINDLKAKYTVCGVSNGYILAHYGQYYTIIRKKPVEWEEYNHNGVRYGDYVIAPDWWIFGYVNGYYFRDEEWCKEYMAELERGDTEMSHKKEAVLWFISVIGHTDKVYAKKKAN